MFFQSTFFFIRPSIVIQDGRKKTCLSPHNQMSILLSSSDVPMPMPDFGLLTPSNARISDNHCGVMFQPVREDPFPTIDSAGLRDLISNYPFYGFDSLIIVDARFDYEYAGGHISRSVNVRSVADMQMLFTQFRDHFACVVFHCEFSTNRGPNLMQQFREYDRQENGSRYPFLDYPTIYLLQGGYSQFFEECPDLCDGGYVPMHDPRFVGNGDLKRCHSSYAASGLRERRQRQRSRCARSERAPAPARNYQPQKRS
jgi:M-phase inducer tyrosine phosphatase